MRRINLRVGDVMSWDGFADKAINTMQMVVRLSEDDVTFLMLDDPCDDAGVGETFEVPTKHILSSSFYRTIVEARSWVCFLSRAPTITTFTTEEPSSGRIGTSSTRCWGARIGRRTCDSGCCRMDRVPRKGDVMIGRWFMWLVLDAGEVNRDALLLVMDADSDSSSHDHGDLVWWANLGHVRVLSLP